MGGAGGGADHLVVRAVKRHAALDELPHELVVAAQHRDVERRDLLGGGRDHPDEVARLLVDLLVVAAVDAQQLPGRARRAVAHRHLQRLDARAAG